MTSPSGSAFATSLHCITLAGALPTSPRASSQPAAHFTSGNHPPPTQRGARHSKDSTRERRLISRSASFRFTTSSRQRSDLHKSLLRSGTPRTSPTVRMQSNISSRVVGDTCTVVHESLLGCIANITSLLYKRDSWRDSFQSNLVDNPIVCGPSSLVLRVSFSSFIVVATS